MEPTCATIGSRIYDRQYEAGPVGSAPTAGGAASPDGRTPERNPGVVPEGRVPDGGSRLNLYAFVSPCKSVS